MRSTFVVFPDLESNHAGTFYGCLVSEIQFLNGSNEQKCKEQRLPGPGFESSGSIYGGWEH